LFISICCCCRVRQDVRGGCCSRHIKGRRINKYQLFSRAFAEEEDLEDYAATVTQILIQVTITMLVVIILVRTINIPGRDTIR